MKNIYNLLTDAFDRIGKNESHYNVVIQDHYKITITSRTTIDGTYARLTLIMRNTDELYDFHEENTLFTNNEWNEFCMVIDRQIPSAFITAGQLLQLPPLLNGTFNDIIYDEEDATELGDFVLENYRNLTVDTNLEPAFVDVDDDSS